MTLEELRRIWWSRIVPKLEGYPGEGVWLWTGAKTATRLSYKRGKDSTGLPYYHFANQPSMAVLKFEGTRHTVGRLVYLYHHPEMYEVESNWRLQPIGDRYDMNPINWKVIYPKELDFGDNITAEQEASIDAQFEAMMSTEGTLVNDCIELLDGVFSSGKIANFEQVKCHVYMEDFDEATIKEALIEMGKGHLV